LITLAIGDLRHNPDYAWLNLAGASLPQGLIGAVYNPRTGDGRTVEERITLVMKGTPTHIAAVMLRLEEKVALANRYTTEGVGVAHYLRISYEPDASYYYSRILQARLEPKPNSLAYTSGGSLGVDLVFTRADHFDGEQVALPLSNRNGTRVTTGLTVSNHADSGHDNFVSITADDLLTELPAPLRLEITNSTAIGALKDLWVGSYQYNRLSALPQLAYEGESATGGTDVSDANSSGGAFRRVTWADAGWTSLLYWTLSATNLSRFQGRALLPLIRLANAHAYADLQLRLMLKAGNIILYEGDSQYVSADLGYVTFPALRLPPAALSGVLSAQAQSLHLYGNKPNTDSYTLDLDHLQLLPLDAFSHYQGLVNLAQNDTLVDDAFEGLFHGVQGGYELSTHIPIQQGLQVQPEHHTKLVFFQSDGDDAAPIERTLSVKAWYRRRKRVL
jgi:hypothetical protein